MEKEQIERMIDEALLSLPKWEDCYEALPVGCGQDDVRRFVAPMNRDWPQAYREVLSGRKVTHWIWYIFPQMRGLGHSSNSTYYGIGSRDEAKCFADSPFLWQRLLKITEAAYNSERTPYEIFGGDAIKFRSCMLLFASIDRDPIFNKVLVKNRWK